MLNQVTSDEISKSMARTRNVVLFGECGVGKSSIINAIAGKSLADTSNNALGCTIQHASHNVTLRSGIQLKLWDTVGLDEGTFGSVPAAEARQSLKNFLKEQLAGPDGLDLLLYCFRGASGMRGLPVKQGHLDAYKFVFHHVCKKRVPIAMIVTNLESYSPNGSMDEWWGDNEQTLLKLGFQFCAHACVSVLPPELRGPHDDVERIEASRYKLWDLLSRDFLAPRNVLLLGVREDRDDFIGMVNPWRKNPDPNHNAEGSSSFACIPIAFDASTHVHLWNASKLDENDDGDVVVTERSIKQLIQGMNYTAGIDLLLFCFRAGHLKVRHTRNFRLYHAAICRRKVPIAIAVLGPNEGVDSWWQKNEQDLRQKGLRFDRHVYIPFNPCLHPSSPLEDAARRRLIDVVQEEYTLSSWPICDDPSWATVPNVRVITVFGELPWPATVVVCDSTKDGIFARIAPGLQSSLQPGACAQREHRFRQVDPGNVSPIASQHSGNAQSRIPNQGHKGISLLMFLISADDQDNDTWNTLETFYSVHNGDIIPFIVVVQGLPERRLAENFWKDAPRRIKRRVGAHVIHHPGSDGYPDAQATAREIMVHMIRDLCLVDLGEKVRLLHEIQSRWKRYRSQRYRVSDGTVI